MPPNTVYVGRPTKWGNPAKIGTIHWWDWNVKVYPIRNREDAVEYYRDWLPRNFTDKEIREELRGKDLACWCPLSRPCHADILLAIANLEDDE